MKRLLVLPLVAAVAVSVWTTGGLAKPANLPVPCPWVINTGVTGPTPKWLGEIDIPRLGERVQFSRGTKALFSGKEDNSVNHGPSLYPNDHGFGNMPGQGGTVGILGHRTTHTHPFCRFDLMEPGYVVMMQVHQIRYTFRVVYIDQKTDPNSWAYFKHPGRYDRTPNAKGVPVQYLVLAACTPPRYKNYRINIVAKLVAVKRL